MFGSFRARAFALAASLLIGLSAAPAAAAASEASPDPQALATLTAPVAVATPAVALPSVPSIGGSILTPRPATPAIAQRLPLNDLVISFVDYKNQSSEEMCLAKAVYFEARGESLEGQLAVAQVVLNRAASGYYPPTVCGVVTQPAQFSFVRHGRIPQPDETSDAWRRAKAVAQIAQQDLWESKARDAMYFHATYVNPSWSHEKTELAQINTHIFYR